MIGGRFRWAIGRGGGRGMMKVLLVSAYGRMSGGEKYTMSGREEGIVLRPSPTLCHYRVKVRAEHVDVDFEGLWWLANLDSRVPEQGKTDAEIRIEGSFYQVPSLPAPSSMKSSALSGPSCHRLTILLPSTSE